jgi:hypothetical protein
MIQMVLVDGRVGMAKAGDFPSWSEIDVFVPFLAPYVDLPTSLNGDTLLDNELLQMPVLCLEGGLV